MIVQPIWTLELGLLDAFNSTTQWYARNPTSTVGSIPRKLVMLIVVTMVVGFEHQLACQLTEQTYLNH